MVFELINVSDIIKSSFWKPSLNCINYCTAVMEKEIKMISLMPYAINFFLGVLVYLFYEIDKPKCMLYTIYAIMIINILMLVIK